MKIDPTKLKLIPADKICYYPYGTNLKAINPKPEHKYVQHLKNMRDAGFATAKEICPGIKNPCSHEFVQFCLLGLAEKYTNFKETRVYYKITPAGLKLLKKAGV